MKLHESIFISDNDRSIRILRVPGGWIYHIDYYSNNIKGSDVFVPYSEEKTL
jgi:hypothetical protein